MNYERYPWLKDLSSTEALQAIERARQSYQEKGAAIFPQILTREALQHCIDDARAQEAAAFTTDDSHTAYLRPIDHDFPPTSVRNFEMRTQVASIAFDELKKNSHLAEMYACPALRQLVAAVVGEEKIYLSEDPLGCCSINVFRPGYHHSFHFDESKFSTTLMLQEASEPSTGLFQYTNPLREVSSDLALASVSKVIQHHDETARDGFDESKTSETPQLHTLDFHAGTLSIFAGSKSLHRVTRVEGDQSRLVAVLTFASKPGFRNSKEVQELFWGRSL